jgi:hypothetical protein
VVLALNAGMPAYSTWHETIDLVAQTPGTCFAFTDFNEEAMHMAVGIIDHWLVSERNIAWLQPTIPNPFRQPLSRWSGGPALPTYSNGFVAAFRVRQRQA